MIRHRHAALHSLELFSIPQKHVARDKGFSPPHHRWAVPGPGDLAAAGAGSERKHGFGWHKVSRATFKIAGPRPIDGAALGWGLGDSEGS